jgi:hypothetical protein
MKRVVTGPMLFVMLALYAGCRTAPEMPNVVTTVRTPLACFLINHKYYGEVKTRSGSYTQGFITWEPQNHQLLVRSYSRGSRRPRVISCAEVAVVRFRELTPEEVKWLEEEDEALKASITPTPLGKR